MGRADDIRQCLKLLDDTAFLAEQSARSIAGGEPNMQIAYQIPTQRSELGIKLQRAFGKEEGYPRITDALALFATALIHADPTNGLKPGPAEFDLIRAEQRNLRAAILSAADRTLSWRLFERAQTKD